MIKAPSADRPVVVIFRDDLLRPSETFILAQGTALRRYRPIFAGSRRVPGLTVPRDQSIVIAESGRFARPEQVLFKVLRRAPKFERRVRTASPALIHAHFGPDAFRVLPTARRLRVPLVATFHGFDATTTDQWARRSFYGHRVYARHKEQLYQNAALIIAISNYVRDRLLEQGFPDEKIRVLYTGIDLSLFRRADGLPSGAGVIFVGRLVEVKGVEYLIRAMAPLQERHPELSLTIVGDGPMKQQLEAMAARMLRKVQFLGNLPQSEVRALLQQGRVFCGPSVSAQSGATEGLGMVFLEALAMGVPVVAFSQGGIPEAVRDGETGLLAPQKDWLALSSCIERLITDHALHSRLSLAGPRHVREHFDLVTQSARLEALYDEVVAKHSPTVA